MKVEELVKILEEAVKDGLPLDAEIWFHYDSGFCGKVESAGPNYFNSKPEFWIEGI